MAQTQVADTARPGTYAPHSAFSRAHPAPEPAAVAVAASHTGPLSFRRPGPASAPLHHTGLSLHRPIYSSTCAFPSPSSESVSATPLLQPGLSRAARLRP